MNPTQPWYWTNERILEALCTHVAVSAMRGRPSPVAARVIARLEATK